MAVFQLKFGAGTLPVELPDDKILNVVEGKYVEPIADIKEAVRKGLRQPIGTPPFSELFHKGDKVAVVVSDITRSWVHYEVFLPQILDELNTVGIPDADVTVVVALGSHRRHTPPDNIKVYGREVVERVAIIESYGPVADDFKYVGATTRGVNVSLNKHVLAADKTILTGGIVFHDMAGFGGGCKAVLPGVASYSTIQENHRFCLHIETGKGINPQCRSGSLAGNPMHEDMLEIAAMLNPTFLFNVVMTPEGKFAEFFAGDWQAAWEAGCRRVSEIYGVAISQKAELVIASAGGYPKDINMYQGTKAITNSFAACRDGGVIILLMECKEILEPPDFMQWFQYGSLLELEMKLREEFTVPGFTALKMLIRASRIPHIVVTLPHNKPHVERMGMRAVASVEAALELAADILGKRDYTINVMPQAAVTAPLIK